MHLKYLVSLFISSLLICAGCTTPRTTTKLVEPRRPSVRNHESTAFIKATNLKNDIVPGAQSVFDAVNEGYREGKFGYLDMLDAQRSLFDVKKHYIEALASYHKGPLLNVLLVRALVPLSTHQNKIEMEMS